MQHTERSFSLKTMEDGQVLLYSVSMCTQIFVWLLLLACTHGLRFA